VASFTVGYFVGSLAKNSINRKLAVALTRLTPPDLTMREIPIGDLPLYSYDYDADYIQFTPGLITDDGQVTNSSTEEFLRNYMQEYCGFIERVYTALLRGG